MIYAFFLISIQILQCDQESLFYLERGFIVLPTYKNNTNRRITHCDMGYMEWAPGEERRLPLFVPYLELGLTLVSDKPYVKQMVHDWIVTLEKHDVPFELNLPYHESFELSIHCVSGNAAVFFGDSSSSVEIKEGESHFSNYSYARCGYLRFVSPGDAELHVKVEERNTRNSLDRGYA